MKRRWRGGLAKRSLKDIVKRLKRYLKNKDHGIIDTEKAAKEITGQGKWRIHLLWHLGKALVTHAFPSSKNCQTCKLSSFVFFCHKRGSVVRGVVEVGPRYRYLK